jgi:hypothetical protein
MEVTTERVFVFCEDSEDPQVFADPEAWAAWIREDRDLEEDTVSAVLQEFQDPECTKYEDASASFHWATIHRNE